MGYNFEKQLHEVLTSWGILHLRDLIRLMQIKSEREVKRLAGLLAYLKAVRCVRIERGFVCYDCDERLSIRERIRLNNIVVKADYEDDEREILKELKRWLKGAEKQN